MLGWEPIPIFELIWVFYELKEHFRERNVIDACDFKISWNGLKKKKKVLIHDMCA